MKIFAVFVLCCTIFTLVNGERLFGTITQGFQTVRQKTRCNFHKIGSTVFQHQHGNDPCQEQQPSPEITEVYDYITTPRFNLGLPEGNWKPEGSYNPDVNLKPEGSLKPQGNNFEPEENLKPDNKFKTEDEKPVSEGSVTDHEPEDNLKPDNKFKTEDEKPASEGSVTDHEPEENLKPDNKFKTEDEKPVSEGSVTDHDATTEKAAEEVSQKSEISDHATTPGPTFDVRSKDELTSTTPKSSRTFATVPNGKRIINAGSNCPEGERSDGHGNCREEYK